MMKTRKFKINADFFDYLNTPLYIGDICLKPQFSNFQLIVINDIYIKEYIYEYRNGGGTTVRNVYNYIIIEYKYIIPNYPNINSHVGLSNLKYLRIYIGGARPVAAAPNGSNNIISVIKLNEKQKFELYASYLELDYISSITKKLHRDKIHKYTEDVTQ